MPAGRLLHQIDKFANRQATGRHRVVGIQASAGAPFFRSFPLTLDIYCHIDYYTKWGQTVEDEGRVAIAGFG